MKKIALLLVLFWGFSAYAQTPTPTPTPTRTPTAVPTPASFPAWIQYNERVVGANSPFFIDVVNRPTKQIFASYTSQHSPLGVHKFSFATSTPAPVVTPQPTATPVSFPTALPTATPFEFPTPLPTATPFEFPTPLPTATPFEFPPPLPTATPFEFPTPLPTATPNPGLSFPTGMIVPYAGASAPSGWLIANGSTIGNASSGGTARANADTETLFLLLCEAWDNTALPIQDSSGGASTRGGSCATDYAANKRLPLPDLRGRVPIGSGQGSGLTQRVLGVKGGEESHSLTADENGTHDHVERNYNGLLGQELYTDLGGTPLRPALHSTEGTDSTTKLYTSPSGLGTTHNTMQPYIVINFIVRY